MTLTLFSHPLASFCHKVLIALYENGTPFAAETTNFADPGAAALLEKWPIAKIPVLHDATTGRTLPETSIIIEYHPGPVHLLPTDPDKLLDVRLWDRFYDLYVSQPMQKIVTDRLRPTGGNDPHGVAEARATLDTAYGMIAAQMATRQWATGDAFTLADCAALPGLFFATIVHPLPASHPAMAYLGRLMARPSVKRVLNEAQPYFDLFPYKSAMPPRYREPF